MPLWFLEKGSHERFIFYYYVSCMCSVRLASSRLSPSMLMSSCVNFCLPSEVASLVGLAAWWDWGVSAACFSCVDSHLFVSSPVDD